MNVPKPGGHLCTASTTSSTHVVTLAMLTIWQYCVFYSERRSIPQQHYNISNWNKDLRQLWICKFMFRPKPINSLSDSVSWSASWFTESWDSIIGTYNHFIDWSACLMFSILHNYIVFIFHMDIQFHISAHDIFDDNIQGMWMWLSIIDSSLFEVSDVLALLCKSIFKYMFNISTLLWSAYVWI